MMRQSRRCRATAAKNDTAGLNKSTANYGYVVDNRTHDPQRQRYKHPGREDIQKIQ